MGKTASPVSPLAPKSFPKMPPLKGVRLAAVAAGIKYANRVDVLAIELQHGTQVAGVFTTSKCPSAPVDWCRMNLKQGEARGLVVNSGNANAFTGAKGVATVERTAKLAAQALSASEAHIFLASTGVIGEPLDAEKFAPVLGDAFKNAKEDNWSLAAQAIMTTDTFPKGASLTTKIGETSVTLNGIAKGAGMIAPDMATMLSFVFTDAAIAAPVLQSLLSKAVQTSFNAITVDSDTSTSDTLMLFATGAAGNALVSDSKDKRLMPFKRALQKLLDNLSEQVARDGEGATKLLKISVEGAVSSKSAKKIALSIANSPLVKTAAAGEDANWGRIVAAIGKAGEPAERDKLSIYFGPYRVAHEGLRDAGYSEAETSAYMKNQVIEVKVQLNMGKGKFMVKTCDLTKEYVAINGDYRS
jgi:glutamate N-acetyltransferase / amino-acid N-acetyltransferase